MNFSQFWAILQARKWIALWIFGVVVVVTTVVSFLLPKSYTATASLVVNAKGSDPITGNVLPASMLPGYLATQVDILESRAVALQVIDDLKITQNKAAKERFMKATDGKGDMRIWYADQFSESLDIKPSRESSLIDVNYTATDPEFAALMANAFAKAYIDTNVRLKVDPSKEASVFFDKQAKGLRENVEKAQTKLSKFQKEHGITSEDGRLDIETARLNELSSQLVAAQAQTYDSKSRKTQVTSGSLSESQEILSNGLIQTLKSQLVQAEARLADASQRLGENHPMYKASLEEVNKIKHSIEVETAKAGGGLGQSARVSQLRENEIKTALADQKEKVLKLKDELDEMAVLVREVDSAQKIYDSALLRFGQTNMESQSGQTDVAILNQAAAPLKHSRPRRMMNVLLSVFLGGLLAVVVTLLLEMAERRLRAAADLANNLGLPVLVDMTSAPEKWFGKSLLQKLTKQEKTISLARM